MKISGSPHGTWVEERFRDARGRTWLMAARVWVHKGRLLIGECRVFPGEREPGGAVGSFGPAREAAGHWSGDPDRIPRGGLESQTLRSVPLGSVRPFVLSKLRPLERVLPEEEALRRMFRNYMLRGADVLAARPRPRRNTGRDDRYFAVLADEYVRLIETGERRPTTKLAANRSESPAKIRDRLHEARERGLLSPGEPGRRGGSLLPRAIALVKDRPSRRRPPARGTSRRSPR